MGKLQKAKDASKLARKAARAEKAAHVRNAEAVRRLEIRQPHVSKILAKAGEKR